MNIKEHLSDITSGIKAVQNDPLLELEFIFKSTLNNKLDKFAFDTLIKRIKGIYGIKLQANYELLDIFVKEQDGLRYTVKGRNAINAYCKTNSLVELKNGTYSLINKKLRSKVDLNNYNIRMNIKKEENVPLDQDTVDSWYKLNKMFRYKKRFSYITSDNLVSFDLTVVKSSNKKIIALPNKKRKKKDIPDYQKKYVIKPENVVNFNEWWDSLSDTTMVDMKGKKIEEFLYSKTIQSSNVLKNEFEYEVELEYLGNKINYKDSYTNILSKLIKHVGIVLQSLQKSNFVISNQERQIVKNYYNDLMNTYKFSAPMNVTLELKHVVQYDYADYQNILSIRRNYSVTEKADGERNLLIVLDDDSVYLLNRKNEIKSYGCKLPGLAGTLLDGELITKDKDNNNINLFAVFDIYVYKKEDLRDRILNRTEKDKKDGILLESRYEILSSMMDTLTVVPNSKNDTIMIIKKKYFFGDMVTYNKDIDDEITRQKQILLTLDNDSKEYKDIVELIKNYSSDTKIFEEAKKVYNKEYIYHIDGLVFTPVQLIIGDEQDGKKAKFDGRWNKLFKWKPPEENTIDFRVAILKNDTGEDVIQYKEVNGKPVAYKTLTLNVGYDPKIHTKVNSCRVMNEELIYKEGYHDTPFYPTNPYVKNIENAYIPVIDGFIMTSDKNRINDNMIIEFSYNSALGEGFCWIPLRVRNNVTPNDFVTATNVWRTIHNPITTSMIVSGNTPNTSDDVYYFNKTDRKKLSTKSLADFHSYVKKRLITSNSKQGDTLLDVSCGRLGDLNHWMDSKFSKIVGVDINRDNLESIENGACNRVLNMQLDTKNELLKNILLVWGDSSRIIRDGSAAKDDLNKYYLDVIFGETDPINVKNSKLKRFYGIGKKGFDVISCQFSIHYFFENEVKLDIFMINIQENLKSNGTFIGTCLDGSRIFNALKSESSLSVLDKDGSLLWKINKKYENDTFSDDSSSLGYPIDVYMKSIGKTTREWLVNFDYLRYKLDMYGLILDKVESFEDIWNKEKGYSKYGDASKMSNDLQQYSFLNSTFVITKK